MIPLNIYMFVLAATYLFKALFLGAVYAYFSYYGGLEGLKKGSEGDSLADTTRNNSVVEYDSINEQNKDLNELIESKLKESDVLKDEI